MICFIDLDGVLVDFVGSAVKLFGKKPEDIPPNTYEMWSYMGCGSPKEFWDRINTSEFWYNLQWTSDGPEILNICERRFGQDNCYIMTAASASPHCYFGKSKWVMEQLPHGYSQRFMIGGRAKWLCADPTRILIDDMDKNITEFRNEGGLAVLIPRRWNTLHHCSKPTVDWLNGQLTFLFGRTI